MWPKARFKFFQFHIRDFTCVDEWGLHGVLNANLVSLIRHFDEKTYNHGFVTSIALSDEFSMFSMALSGRPDKT
jgi:hypothetical protein